MKKPSSSRSVLLDGESVRRARISKGWTLEDLAEKSGLSVRTIDSAENGRGESYVRTLKAIATALGENPRALLANTNVPEKLSYEDLGEMVAISITVRLPKNQLDETALPHFVRLLNAIAQTGSLQVIGVKEGSTIITLIASREDFYKLRDALFGNMDNPRLIDPRVEAMTDADVFSVNRSHLPPEYWDEMDKAMLNMIEGIEMVGPASEFYDRMENDIY